MPIFLTNRVWGDVSLCPRSLYFTRGGGGGEVSRSPHGKEIIENSCKLNAIIRGRIYILFYVKWHIDQSYTLFPAFSCFLISDYKFGGAP